MSNGPPLPAELEIHSDKIFLYLLNPDHPKGGAKAKFFLSFGYQARTAKDFAQAVFAQALGSTTWHATPTEYGSRMVTCLGPMWTPSGEKPWVRSVWLVAHDGSASLITVVPDHDPEG